MELHYKSSVWTRVSFKDSEVIKLIEEKLKAGATISDLANTPEIVEAMGEIEVMEETEQALKPEENNNESTIELMKSIASGLECYWNNSIK